MWWGEFYALGLGACADQFLIGTQQVAWLNFTAVSNQPSALPTLFLDDIIGRQPDGTAVRNFAPQSGRVVVVGEEPLLEALRTTNGLVQFLLYAPVGTTNEVQTNHGVPSSSWAPWGQVVMTNLLQSLPPVSPTKQALFLRAIRQ